MVTVLLLPSVPAGTALADAPGSASCAEASFVWRKDSFSKAERRQIQEIGRTLRASTDRGARVIGGLVAKARNDTRRETALWAMLGWCVAHGYDGSTSAPSASAGGHPLGKEVVGPSEARLTVFSYTSPGTSAITVSAESAGGPPGAVWANSDVQVCAPAAGEVRVSPTKFKVVFADNTRAEATYGAPDPDLPFTTVSDGACVRGNLAFAVDPARAAEAVLYEEPVGSGSPIRWATT
jgi:hypothetical protein